MQTPQAAGLDCWHVVEGLACLTEPWNFGGMNEACREVLSFPSRAAAEAGLVFLDGLVEIMFTAV